MKGLLRILSLAIFFIAPLVCAEDEQRDFYAEPGMNPFKTAAGQDVTENIDPFSGNIQLSYVDMTIPGNGGMDINITRIYNLPQSIPSYNNPYGYGWTMHFGRITIGSGSVTQLCGTGAIGGGDTRDNPSIEMPDGGREILVHSAELADGTFISKSNWIASCIDPNDYTQGVEVTAPNGTVYFMQEHAYIQGEDGSQGEPAPFTETWFTNQIVDTYGNTLDITYLSIASGMKLISQLDASDGRQVLFSYLDENDQDVSAASNSARLSEVTANNQTWQYLYNPISEVSTGWGGIQHYTLDQVVRPDGTSWNYDYGLVNADPDYNRITKVTYPFGGEVNYTYQKFKPYSPNDTFEIVAIDSKTQTNPGHASGTWTYNFQPGSVLFQDLGFTEPNNFGRKADRTEITTPAGIEHVYHAGYWSAVGLTNVLFQMGLKLRHDFLAVDPDDGSLSVIKSIRNSWSFRSISDEDYRQGILSSLWDDQVYVPVLESEFTSIYGYGSRTDYSSHDAFGHPGIVTEYSNYLNIGDKVTTKTYVNDTTNWFIGLLSTEVVSQDGVDKGTVSRTYNANGRPETEDQFGVVTQYSYTSDGDLYQVTDARNNSTTYSNYFRGTPQLESYSDNTQLSRVVNPTGTVASETSGRGHTTAFTYDNLNRLTGIDYPVGTDVSITWASNGKTLTRGSYQEVVEWDGFGRDIKVTRKDVALGFTYDKTFEYDELGRKTFESDPNSTSGITWEYDQLNRITKVINQDNTFKTITYDGANRELHYDEKNNEKEFKYLIFGGPENKYLKDILSPEGVGTFIDYDVYGNIITVFQGEIDPLDPAHYIGYERVYQYDSKFFLTSTINPETGVTLFERDSVGNMLSEKVGDSLTTNYLYDEMNRRELIDYPETTPDVTFTYDDDGNLESVANTNSTRVNHYDENGNLIIEDISIEGNSYQIRYELDTNDNVKNIVYPSGRVVSYMPDALGRPSMVSPYISSITYFPDGSLKQAAYTNGQTVDYTRTDRHWIDKITVSKFSTILDLDYDYDFNGNILSISDLSAPSVNKVMTYDSLNRMSSVSGIWGLSDFEYDGFSNFKKKTNPNSPGLTAHYSYIEESLLLDKITYDELSSWREIKYDQKANIISDNNISLGVGGVNGLLIERNYGFDHAGNLVGASRETSGNLLATGFFQAKYDGNNNRVIKDGTTTGLRTEYVHNNLGVLLGEYEEVIPTYGMEYIYLGSSIVASAKSNMPPVVITEPDKVVANGYLVTIRSLGSYDKDGRIPEFDWQQISGPSVVLNKNGFSATFTAPSVAGPEDMVFQLTGTDDRGGIGSDFLTVTVQPNTPPLANAGTDQTAPAGASVVLDGSGSGDQEEGSLTYLWEQIGGALVSFDSSLASPVFVAPTPTVEELLTFRLTVTDISGLASSDEVVVSVSPNQPPIANAGADYVLVGGYQGVLDGSASVDPEGQPLVYLWAQTAGETVQLFTGGSTASKKFTAPELSSHSALTFELKVTDIGGDISTDSVDITVLSQTVNDDSDVLPDWWEIVNFGDISTYDGDGDPDADGILNSQEYQEATDPNIAEAIPQPVTEINAKAGDGENIIYWESVVSAASYDILWGNTPGFDVASASVIEDVRSPFVHSSLTNGNEYYYRIVAKNNTGSSAGFAEVLAKPGQLDWVQSISVSANAQLLGNGKGYKFFYRKVDDATSDIYGRVFDSYFGQRFDIYNGWTAEENTHVSIDNTEEGKLVGTIDDEGTTFLAAVRTTGNLGAKSLWAYAAWRNDSSWLGTLVETIDRTSHSGNWVLSNVNYIGGVHGVGNGKFYTTFTQNIGISDFLEGGGAFRMMPRKGTCYLTKAPSKFLSCADNTLDVPGSGVLVEVIDVEASVNNQHGTYVYRYLYDNDSDLSTDGPWVYGARTGDLLGNISKSFIGLAGKDSESVSGYQLHEHADGVTHLVTAELVSTKKNAKFTLQERITDPVTGSWGPVTEIPRVNSRSDAELVGLYTSEAGHELLVWIEGGSLYARISEPNLSWGDPVLIGATADTNTVFAGIGARGIAYITWSDGSDTLIRRLGLDRSWQAPVNMSITHELNAWPTGLVVDDYGFASVAWGDGSITYLSEHKAKDVAPPQNILPVADAGLNQALLEGAVVQLDGSASYDSDGVISSYLWQQTSGTNVTLSDTSSATPSFTAPLVSTDEQLGFQLTVTDDQGATDTANVTITVQNTGTGNLPPVADAGISQTVQEGDSVQLDGSASSDSDGTITNYLWQQTSGTSASLSNTTSATPSFTAPLVIADEQLTFQLTVTDDQGATDSDSVNVTVQNIAGPDTTPPVTTFSTQRKTVKGAPKHTVTLTVNESATTYFRFNGQGAITAGGTDTTAWQTYTVSVVVQLAKKGSGDFEFYSEDTTGNVEATQLEVLQ